MLTSPPLRPAAGDFGAGNRLTGAMSSPATRRMKPRRRFCTIRLPVLRPLEIFRCPVDLADDTDADHPPNRNARSSTASP